MSSPICRQAFTELDLLRINVKQDEDNNAALERKERKLDFQSIHFKKSSKLSALIKGLKDMKKSNPGAKAVVFSQWTSMLDLVEVVLNENNFKFARLDGTLSQKQREQTLKIFKGDDDTKILLASLRSTGVGLNLTEASFVFMLDPWWNESVETQ